MLGLNHLLWRGIGAELAGAVAVCGAFIQRNAT